jgi:ABC-type transport system involved in multi-copper enzyme maturation permease subunit
MISILLLAKNFIRQNRWLLLAFVLWPLLLGSLVRSPGEATTADLSELLQQEMFYGLVVVAFLASSAIYNEKRSRRIVAVLSKAVSRAQYLVGFMGGAICFAGIYFVAVGVSVVWFVRYPHLTFAAAATWLLQSLIASIWISSAALLFSTFLHPFIAAALTGVAAFAPLALRQRNVLLTPMATLVEDLTATRRTISWTVVLIAVVESVLFITIAAWIFARRDVTVSIE